MLDLGKVWMRYLATDVNPFAEVIEIRVPVGRPLIA